MTIDHQRRNLIGASLGTAALAGAAAVGAPDAQGAGRRRRLDLANPEDTLYAAVKLRGDTSGAQVLQWYTGTISLVVPGRAPAPVARYQGCIRTTWAPQPDGSYRYRAFDLGFFGDLASGKPVQALTNPLTGASIVPLDVRDGPVESHYTVHGVFRDGKAVDGSRQLSLPWVAAGDELWYGADLAFEYPNPLPPDRYPQLSSSDRVVQRSVFTYKGRRSELEDSRSTSAPMSTVLVVTSTIHPWLKMGRLPGVQVVHTISHKIASIEQASAEVRDYIARVMPEFLTAETPFTGAGNSFERYRRERLGVGASAVAVTGSSGATRRWRHYVRGRFGQVHVTSAASAAARPGALPLVCLHPSPTTGEMYAELQAQLATDRVVHCPDTPGYGSSDPPRDKPTIMDYGGGLADAIAELALDRRYSDAGKVDLFGFHTGSLCAVEVALQRPDLVRRLILSGVPHYGDAAQRERERRSHVRGYPYFEDRAYVGRIYERLVLDAKDSGSPEARLRRFGERLRAGPNGWWGPDAVFSYDSTTALPRLALPTLLIAFNEEMTEPTRQAAKLIAQSRLVEMLDLPIFGFIVAPQRVAATMREFLDAQEAT